MSELRSVLVSCSCGHALTAVTEMLADELAGLKYWFIEIGRRYI